MTEDKRVYWLWLSLVFGAGNPVLWETCRGYPRIEDFAEEVQKGAFDQKLTNSQKNRRSAPFDEALRIVEKCENAGVQVLTYRDEGYPARLRTIPNPPHVLFVKGDTNVLSLDVTTAAIVGTRAPTAYSVGVAERLTNELAERGVTVISGLEDGIDSVAGEAAADAQGHAAAVCGRGIFSEKYVPEQVRKIEHCGVILAEYTSHEDFGTVSFDKRNRLLCGLADAVIFIECRADSSGLNNVIHAAKLGKPVLTVPPRDIYDARFFGQRGLIRRGAGVVFSADDVLKAVSAPYKPLADEAAESKNSVPKKKERVKNKKNKSSIGGGGLALFRRNKRCSCCRYRRRFKLEKCEEKSRRGLA